MKSSCLSFLFVFVLAGNVGAIDYIDVHGSGCSTPKVFKASLTKVNKGATDYEHCADSVLAFRDEVMAWKFNNMDCVGYGSYTADCYVMIVNVCCDPAVLATDNTLEDVTVAHNVISGVPVGGEKMAAETYFSQFKSEAAVPVHEGMSITDVHAGYVFSGNMNVESSTVDVTVDAWKRAGYTGTGVTPIPLGDIGASGVGGLSKADTIDSFVTALGVKKLSDGELGAQMKGAFDYAHEQGYFGAESGGITSGDLQSAMESALAAKVPLGEFTGGLNLGEAYSKAQPAGEFTETYNSFVDTVKNTGLGRLGSAFFSGVPTSAGDAPVMTVNGGSVFGVHSFDFSVLVPALNIIKTCVILAFTFIGVRLVVVNK